MQQAATAGLLAALRLPDPALVGTASVALGHAGLRWVGFPVPAWKSGRCHRGLLMFPPKSSDRGTPVPRDHLAACSRILQFAAGDNPRPLRVACCAAQARVAGQEW